MVTEIVGFLAAFTSTISLIPQIIKVHSTKSVTDLSTLMIMNFLLTSVLWVTYGIKIGSVAVCAANIIMTLFSMWLLILKYRYERSV